MMRPAERHGHIAVTASLRLDAWSFPSIDTAWVFTRRVMRRPAEGA
jgi:hypothetical protein